MSKKPTILITGCSSGFGLDTASLFLERGWNVVATMRSPREDVLPRAEGLRIVPLDVTNSESIQRCVELAGPIDALVNNAGIGMGGVLEGTSMASIRKVFDTNALGTIEMTQAVIPQFRARRSGVVVNVSSGVTLRPMAMLAVYSGSKAAVNAFSEALALELEEFNVRVRLVISGHAPSTNFGSNAQKSSAPAAYAELEQRVIADRPKSAMGGPTTARDVSEAVWKGVTDPTSPMWLPAGPDPVARLAKMGK
jgi:NAD(P)-dependent dehydrogenase (short-subunit alcohol dehydrogenase family)